jgi:sialic acid synthase SpsE
LSKGLTEKKSILFRRTLNDVKNLKAGDVLTKENVRAIRPGLGLPTKYLEVVLGMKVKHNIECGTALKWDLIN